MTNVVCIKVYNLRKEGFSDLEEWMNASGNVYTGRRGRIFIHANGEQRIFHYKGSKWQNPFTLKKYDLKKSLSLYVIYLFQTGLIYDIEELRGKNLGCFCEKHRDSNGNPTCHAQVLTDLLGPCYEIIKDLK
jgi:hypothetical protein